MTITNTFSFLNNLNTIVQAMNRKRTLYFCTNIYEKWMMFIYFLILSISNKQLTFENKFYCNNKTLKLNLNYLYFLILLFLWHARNVYFIF